MALKMSKGVLVSWRLRASDDPTDIRFRLYRGKTLITKIPVCGKTNYLDTSGSASSVYKLEVIDGQGNLLDTINVESNIESSPVAFDNYIVIGTRVKGIFGLKIY